MDATMVIPVTRPRRSRTTSAVMVALATLAAAGLVTLLISVTVLHAPDDSDGPPISLPSRQTMTDHDGTITSSTTRSGTARPSVTSQSCPAHQSCTPSASEARAGGDEPAAVSSTMIASPSTSHDVAPVTATYVTVSAPSNSFRGRLTLVNRTETTQTWQVVLEFPAGVQVTSVTTGSFATSSQRVTFTGAPLTAKQTLIVEFNASRPYLATFAPIGCVVNAVACD